MEQVWKDIRANAASAVVPTVLAALVYLMNYFVFGEENTLMMPFVILSFLRLRQMHYHLGCMLKHLLLYVLIACAAYLAVKGALACAAVNLAALFLIGYYVIDEYNPRNYLSAAMAVGFFQLAPVTTPEALGLRVLALCCSFALFFLYAAVARKMAPETRPLSELTAEGFALSDALLRAAEGGAPDLTAHLPLCELNHRLSSEIYASNRAALGRCNRVNWYCRFVGVFEVVNALSSPGATPEDLAKARSIHERFHEEFTHRQPEMKYLRLRLRDHRPDRRSFRLRFALRLALVGTAILVFRLVSQLPNTFWFVISVLTMMIPFSNETLHRVKQRVGGTFVGLILCFALFSLFRSAWAHMLIMMAANFFIYASGSYGATAAFITCSAMATQTVDVALPETLLLRMAWTLAGAAVALLANYFLFPVRADRQIEYLRELLARLRQGLPTARTREWDSVLIKSYLIIQRIQALNKTLPQPDPELRVMEEEREHMQFLADYLLHGPK